jgi:ABC-type multidrug transport system fused ATPase/permease subunit
MDASTDARVSMDIANFGRTFSQNFKKYDSEMREKEKKNFLSSKCLTWVFKNPRALVKENITVQDLPPLMREFSIEEIDKHVQTQTDQILKSRHQYNKVFKDVHSVYGLFDYIIKRIVRRERLHLLLFQLVSGLIRVYLFYSTFKVWDNSRWGENGEIEINYVAKINWPVSIILAFLIHLCALQVLKCKDRITLLARQTLWQLIQEKLSVSDMCFLDNADNNMIYKLLYLEFEDYARSVPFIGDLLDICPIALYLVYRSLMRDTGLSLISIGILVMRLCLNILFGYLQRIYHVKYKSLTYEMRKSIYEFIKNYKSFTLKNLKGRYKTIAEGLIFHKSYLLRRLRLMGSIQGLISLGSLSCLICLPLLGVPAATPSISHIIPYFILFLMLDSTLDTLANDLMELFYYQSSRKVFDKFFDNDFVVDTVKQHSDTLPKGTIIIKGCEVLERDPKNIIQVLNYIRHKEEDLKYDFKTKVLETKRMQTLRKRKTSIVNSEISPEARKIGFEGRSENRTSTSLYKSQPSVHMRALQRGESLQQFKHHLSRLKVMFSGLSLDIPPGGRACVQDGPNKSCIKAFMNLLLGECFLNRGHVLTNGRTAYYTTHAPFFLVGRTIRDNIVFGQEFRPERYAKILQMLGLQFGNYIGYDYYEVAEAALNLKHTDRRLILLARFLYQDVDIYLIDVGFYELCQSINHGMIRYLFQNFLLNKTIVFISDKPEMMAFSQKVIIFGRDDSHKVINTSRYMADSTPLRKTSISRLTLGENILEPRVQVLNTKLKNSVFLFNVTFEEELRIHKQQEQRKAEIAKMRQNNTNIFEILSYGIYLTNKRRQEGKNIKDTVDFDISILLRELKGTFIGFFKIKTLMITLFLYIVRIVAFIALEIYVFSIYKLRVEGYQPSGTRRLELLIFIGVVLGLYGLRVIIFEKFVEEKAQQINQKQLNTLIYAGIDQILRMRSHRVLDKINREAIELEVNIPKILHNGFENLGHFACLSIALLYLYSAILPLISLFLVLISMYYSIKVFLLYYIKLIGLLDKSEYKLDDFNFQLLGLIANYRPAGMLELLVKKRTKLVDNNARIRSAILFDLRHNYRLVASAIHFLWFVAYLSLFYVFQNWPVLNLFKVTTNLFAWSSVLFIKLIHASWAFQASLLQNENTLLAFYRLSTFLESTNSQNATQMDYSSYKTRVLSNTAYTVIFKNVSLTLGYQPVLKKISFKVYKGQKVGVVGVDGGGRAALFDLICGVMKRDNQAESDIIVLGLKVEDLAQHLDSSSDEGSQSQSHADKDKRKSGKHIFFIERSPALIEGTIRENIDPNSEVEDEFIVNILLKLCFEKVVSRDQIESRRDIKFDPRFFVDKKKSIFDLGDHTHKDRRMMSQFTHQFVPEGQINPSIAHANIHFNTQSDIGGKNLIKEDRKKRILLTKTEHQRESLDQSGMKKYSGGVGSKTQGALLQTGGRLLTLIDNNIIEPVEERVEQIPQSREAPAQTPNTEHRIESEDSVKTLKKCDTGRVLQKDVTPIEINDIKSNETQKQALENKLVQLQQVHSRIKQGENFDIELPPRRVSVADANQQPASPASPTNISPARRMIVIEPDPILDQEEMEEQIELPDGKSFSDSMEISSMHSPESRISMKYSEFIDKEEIDLEPGDGEEKKIENRAKRSSLLWAGHRSPEEEAPLFLKKKTVFEGRNFDKITRRLVVFCRALITKPKLLLTFEESLDFGLGFAENLKLFSEMVPEASVICVTKTTSCLLSFGNILFLDAGKILEKGKPSNLIRNQNSFLYKYLKETDRMGLELLEAELDQEERESGKQLYYSSPRLELEEVQSSPEDQIIQKEKDHREERSAALHGGVPPSTMHSRDSSIMPMKPGFSSGEILKAFQTHGSNKLLSIDYRSPGLPKKVDPEDMSEFNATERQGIETSCRLFSTGRKSIHPDYSPKHAFDEKVKAEQVPYFSSGSNSLSQLGTHR